MIISIILLKVFIKNGKRRNKRGKIFNKKKFKFPINLMQVYQILRRRIKMTNKLKKKTNPRIPPKWRRRLTKM